MTNKYSPSEIPYLLGWSKEEADIKLVYLRSNLNLNSYYRDSLLIAKCRRTNDESLHDFARSSCGLYCNLQSTTYESKDWTKHGNNSKRTIDSRASHGPGPTVAVRSRRRVKYEWSASTWGYLITTKTSCHATSILVWSFKLGCNTPLCWYIMDFQASSSRRFRNRCNANVAPLAVWHMCDRILWAKDATKLEAVSMSWEDISCSCPKKWVQKRLVIE